MPVDYHLHTPLCRHAVGEPEEYCLQARRVGLREIGFSDHGPMPPDYDPEWRMREVELDGYVARVVGLREQFPDLTVRLGLEADFHPGTEEYVRGLLKRHPFDYVIGSVHYLDDWGFDNPEHRARFEQVDLHETYCRYYERVRGLAESGLFDILGHPDVIKKFGYRPSRDLQSVERRAFESVARAGMALDVNTSGLRFPCRELYPSERLLRMAREMEIEVTLGSDSHRPEHVGKDYGEAQAALKRAGYSRLVRFSGRKREELPLP